jgi:hypothetical protein
MAVKAGKLFVWLKNIRDFVIEFFYHSTGTEKINVDEFSSEVETAQITDIRAYSLYNYPISPSRKTENQEMMELMQNIGAGNTLQSHNKIQEITGRDTNFDKLKILESKNIIRIETQDDDLD